MIRGRKVMITIVIVLLSGSRAFGGDSGESSRLLISSEDSGTQPASRLERRIHQRINRIREDSGLEPLKSEKSMVRVARDYSCRMAAEGFFSHRTPSGQTSAGRLRQAGLDFTLLGENIGMTSGLADPLDTIVEGWMESEGHRENILNPRFTRTGVGVCKKGDDYFVTQVFRRP